MQVGDVQQLIARQRQLTLIILYTAFPTTLIIGTRYKNVIVAKVTKTMAFTRRVCVHRPSPPAAATTFISCFVSKWLRCQVWGE